MNVLACEKFLRHLDLSLGVSYRDHWAGRSVPLCGSAWKVSHSHPFLSKPNVGLIPVHQVWRTVTRKVGNAHPNFHHRCRALPLYLYWLFHLLPVSWLKIQPPEDTLPSPLGSSHLEVGQPNCKVPEVWGRVCFVHVPTPRDKRVQLNTHLSNEWESNNSCPPCPQTVLSSPLPINGDVRNVNG